MSISISSFSQSQTDFNVTAPQGHRPPPSGGPDDASPPSHAEAIQTLGSSLSEDVQEEMLATVEAMQEDGASFDDIKAYVDGELEASGAEARPGQLLNIQA